MCDSFLCPVAAPVAASGGGGAGEPSADVVAPSPLPQPLDFVGRLILGVQGAHTAGNASSGEKTTTAGDARTLAEAVADVHRFAERKRQLETQVWPLFPYHVMHYVVQFCF